MKTFNYFSNAKSINISNQKISKNKSINQNTSENNNEDNTKIETPKFSSPINHSHTYKKVTEKDCNDLKILVKKSVDDINDLLNLKELQNPINNKNNIKHTSALSLDNNVNKTLKSDNRNLTNSKTNFTFNINNYINIPSNNMNNTKKINRYEEESDRNQTDKQMINYSSNIKNKTQTFIPEKLIKSMNSITVNKKIVNNNINGFKKKENKKINNNNFLNNKITISPNSKKINENKLKKEKKSIKKILSHTQKLKNTSDINIFNQKFNSSINDISQLNHQSNTPRDNEKKDLQKKNNYIRSISSNSKIFIRNINSSTNVKKHNNQSLSKEKEKLNYHQILNKIYSKEFPYELGNTNDILKLMLFLNEYLINNNVLKDYYLPQNRNLLNEYSKYLASKINVNYPEAIEINHSELDNVVYSAKIIQRYWRKKKVTKFLKNKNTESHELKKMVVNNYIKSGGYKVKKIIGLFNSLVENFATLSYYDNDLNEMFHYTAKIINNNLTKYEQHLLYKNYINDIVLEKYK